MNRLLWILLALGLHACSSSSADRDEGSADLPAAADASSTAADEGSGTPVERLEIETLTFEVEITAPVARVWETMLDPEGYTTWTAPFTPGSTFEGSWQEGERMLFLGPGNSGMVAEIAANRRHELLSIRHLGFYLDGVEEIDSDAVKSWAPAYETYRFAPTANGTRVTVEHEVIAAYSGMMESVWPRALDELRKLCEEPGS